MANPIRPKDVVREYKHRFVHYIADIRAYQRYYNATQYAGDFDKAPMYKAFSIVGLLEVTIDRFLIESCGVAGQYSTEDMTIILPRANEMFPTHHDPSFTGWRHKTLMACPAMSLSGGMRGVYCFDTFAIDNTYGEDGHVLWAKYQFTARWSSLTDLAALIK